ncbi:hypothetical protein Acr_11g0005580 [Actinidia rufa]|uniref:Uncharacterized protein n=1 Tax=Actinidia rufa TaxID=165716 RepID=A0A7J0FC27_9ERIC|nr:hypothetical protein Acr_11g0005580 [Actinidia rufa]
MQKAEESGGNYGDVQCLMKGSGVYGEYGCLLGCLVGMERVRGGRMGRFVVAMCGGYVICGFGPVS